MLTSLEINNVALIDRLNIELEPKMTVLTGETGAGKSIIIDSVNLILGARANKGLIRYGEDKARVQAVFTVSGQTAEKLAALGVRGILNFTNVELDLAHTSTAVQNVHIGDSLMQLTYKMRAGTALHEDEDGKEE